MTWIMWLQDPVMREFAIQAGGGSFFANFTGNPAAQINQGFYNNQADAPAGRPRPVEETTGTRVCRRTGDWRSGCRGTAAVELPHPGPAAPPLRPGHPGDGQQDQVALLAGRVPVSVLWRDRAARPAAAWELAVQQDGRGRLPAKWARRRRK